MAQREEEMRLQMEMLQGLIEGVRKQGEAATVKAEQGQDIKIAKLTEHDDIVDSSLTSPPLSD